MRRHGLLRICLLVIAFLLSQLLTIVFPKITNFVTTAAVAEQLLLVILSFP